MADVLAILDDHSITVSAGDVANMANNTLYACPLPTTLTTPIWTQGQDFSSDNWNVISESCAISLDVRADLMYNSTQEWRRVWLDSVLGISRCLHAFKMHAWLASAAKGCRGTGRYVKRLPKLSQFDAKG